MQTHRAGMRCVVARVYCWYHFHRDCNTVNLVYGTCTSLGFNTLSLIFSKFGNSYSAMGVAALATASTTIVVWCLLLRRGGGGGCPPKNTCTRLHVPGRLRMCHIDCKRVFKKVKFISLRNPGRDTQSGVVWVPVSMAHTAVL